MEKVRVSRNSVCKGPEVGGSRIIQRMERPPERYREGEGLWLEGAAGPISWGL